MTKIEPRTNELAEFLALELARIDGTGPYPFADHGVRVDEAFAIENRASDVRVYLSDGTVFEVSVRRYLSDGSREVYVSDEEFDEVKEKGRDPLDPASYDRALA